MATGYFSHPDCLAHDMGTGHPECAQRIHAIEDQLRAHGLDALLVPGEVPLASNDDLALAHELNYVLTLDDFLQHLEASGDTRALDPDTWACPGTRSAAWRAAGAAVAATDAVIDRKLDNAFCAVRPPGHHAMRGQTMGFCFFNNVAVAARHALDRRGLQRVAVVDFDVHHGNGTEDILAGDDRVLMVGLFQHPFYPYSGADSRAGNMVNVPVPARSDGHLVRDVVESYWLYRLEDFKPEMIFISAGFDAHREDEMGGLGLVEADYVWITQKILDVARRHAQGRVVSCLEGGYHLSALGRSVAAHVKALMEA
ncbi:histone deacetylase family protein [Aquabacterium fontiphilum]|jgi:acetoin utilization deacetylase AcuC-like enzyme|uniref:histone deacetylase family protein n=1 Tax=Aquabacterium fontiphilum TaxID=450365 RepID=UPI001377ACE3|nr:histone deacetylase family protein [Aquabacterium fontiphilum]NBD21012.1 histone deacetylase family protein [Aquabacterium fontiphilum]